MKTFKEHISESADISHVRNDLPDHFDVSHSPHCDRHHHGRGQGLGIKITVRDQTGGKSFEEHRKDAVQAVSKAHAHTGVLYTTHNEPSFHMTVWPKK